MSNKLYLGIIKTVWAYDGATPLPTVPEFGKASQYAYDVMVNFDDGAVLVEGMIPAEERYDDSVNVIPLQVGRGVVVASIGGQLQLLASEKLHVIACGGGP